MATVFRGAAVHAVFLLLVTAHAHAQPAKVTPASEMIAATELRLADVVAVAMRQSPDLERARIDVDAARGGVMRAEGVEDTHVGLSATGDLLHAVIGDPIGDHDTEQVAVTARRALPTGGVLHIAASGRRDAQAGVNVNPDGSVSASVFKRYSAGLEIGLTQPLLRGAGSDAFEAPIRQAASQRDAAALTSEARARDLLVSLAQAYWQVAFAWRQLEVRKASLELAQRQLALTESAIRAEKVPRSETLAVQQAIATRKQDVIAGEQELYERSVALRQLAGLEISPTEIAIRTEALPDKVDAVALDPAAVMRGAFDHSAELAALEASRRGAEAALAAADSAARSQLDLDLSAGPSAAGLTAADALRTVTQNPGYTVTGTLSFDHAIERRTERGGQTVARAAVLTAKVAERDARAKLAVRATRAVQRARAALASVGLAGDAIDLAEQNVTAEQKRFELGKSTNFDVLRRQDELQQSRLREAAAVVDYLAARADLDGLSGAILARYHIVMP
jgi:outer membrane protein TolC